MITVYQLDDARLLLGGPRTVYTKGHLQVLVTPPEVPTGHAARWETELCPVVDTPTFGDAGTGAWELIEDHRNDTLYTDDGEYKIGDEYDGDMYDGLGPIPSWLSSDAPEPPEIPDLVPQQVTRAQGKAALIQSGLWQSVEDYVDGIEDVTEKALALVALGDTTHWSRTSPFLAKAAQALSLNENDLDNLFIEAAKIEL